MKFLIYGLLDPRDGRVRYIGKSTTGLKRPRAHVSPSVLGKERTHKANWLRGLTAAGMSPAIRILESFEAADGLAAAECFWIAQGRGLGWPLTNLTVGGEGVPGYVPTPETRARLSAARKGKSPSAETRAKISAANRGRQKSARECENISRGKQGWKPSSETLRRMSAASRGRRLSLERAAKLHASRRGVPMTPEHKAKIGAALRGRSIPTEMRARIAAALLGRPRGPHSPEHRARISAALRARAAARPAEGGT